MNEVRQRPAHEIRYRGVKVVIWRNATATGHMFNATAARLYKDDTDNWQESSSFGLDDLLVLAEALRAAFLWVHAQRASQSDVPVSA